MTDGPGPRTRLTAVALLAPTSAALLAGLLAWATAHQPGVPLAKTAGSPSAAPTTASSNRLRKESEVQRLRQQISSMRDRLDALPQDNDDGAAASGGSSGARSRSGKGAGPSRTAKPKPKPARTAPPPVQATTGAS